MGSFLPASALDTFLFFLCLSFPFPLSFGCDICCLFFCLSTFHFLLQNCSLPPTWQDKMGTWRKWPFPLFSTTLASYILFFPSITFFCCVYMSALSSHVVLRKTNRWDCTMKRIKDLGKRQREERGRPLWEVQLVENLQTCQFQLVHSGLWTQHFYFPCPLRERQMFCLSALQLKLFPRCSRPFEASQWAN